MAYDAVDSAGSLSAVKASSYSCGWRIQRKYFNDGKPITQVIPLKAWRAMGFSEDMTIEQARSRCAQLNGQGAVAREKTRKAAARVAKSELLQSAFLPVHYAEAFEKLIAGRRTASDRHKKKMASHWKKLQLLISDLAVDPSKYADHAETIYDWFAEREISLEYTLKLIGLLNRWGLMCSKDEGKFFEQVPMPRGKDRELIADAYYDSETFRGESNPLTPKVLEAKRSTLIESQYRWLFISVWFGLRPQEISALTSENDKLWKIQHHADLGCDVLYVYQPKLTAVERSKRWKKIPAFAPQQIKALEYIKEGDLKAPLYKTMDSAFGVPRITLYGGRKGFEGLMTSLGQDLRDISMWMGHQTIERTWTKYRDREAVKFTPPKKEKATG
jgi:hypothetical protein